MEELKLLGKAMSARKLCENNTRWVIQIRTSMIRDYLAKGVRPDESDVWLWSLWSGYLRDGKQDTLVEYFNNRQPAVIHASGHAAPESLMALAKAMNPSMLIPVHGDSWQENTGSFDTIRIVANGEHIALK